MTAFSKHATSDLTQILCLQLKWAGDRASASNAKVLLREAGASVELYFGEVKARFQPGTSRGELLRLWKAGHTGQSKRHLLEGLANLSPATLAYLEQRALRIWPALGLGPAFKRGLLAWAEPATAEDLAAMLVRCCAEGREFVDGRSRPSGRRSKGKFQPVILGIADRSTGKKANSDPQEPDKLTYPPASPRSKAGRSQIDEKISLISNLANDWYRVTGEVPTGGRSGHKPLGEFIISVFEWAEIDGVENGLRVYWSERKSRKGCAEGTPPA